ncbi:MAG TPA: hypothetical protein VGT08_10695 [Terracidiphilus sp.]|nr:hypothetical protein [Terracidiphilus sp.]
MKTPDFSDAPDSLPTSLGFTRRELIQGVAALTASSLFTGCGGSVASSSQIPPSGSNPQPTPSGTLIGASLAVIATAGGSIAPAFAGLSYEKSQVHQPVFTASNSNLIGLFKRIGPSVLRIGGNTVDQTVWNPSGVGQTAGQVAPSDIAAVAAFVKAAGWQCLYGINLGGSATGATNTTLAAQEVAYAYQQFGSSLLGIEIGNECDLYGKTGGYYDGNWSLSQFLTLWELYRSAILATTPSVPITGPADASSISSWTIPFGQAVTKSEITLLTQHYYRGNGQSPTSTAAFLVTPDSTLVNNLATLNTGARGIGIPYRMAECNSFYNGGASGVSNSYASSLWAIDYLFDCALGGAVGVNFHGGGNGTGYTPIADSNGTVVGARPEYYGILLFTLAGQGTLYTTQLAAGGLNVTAYAVKIASGGLNLVIVNKDLTSNLTLTIQLPQSATTATLLEMTQLSQGATAPNLTATGGVTIQGASVLNDGTFSPSAAYTLSLSGSQLKCYVPALSAVLIQIA